ncbi:hypothetical protein BH10BDE1_BH10BDE1_31410 [soil metagenome]
MAQRRFGSPLKSRIYSLVGSLAIVVGAGGVVGCQSSRLKEFETVRGGMSKDQVIELVGGPIRTQRWHGRDRWEYRFYNTSEGDVIREVHFEAGKSTYVGSAIKPAISADEQDRLNAMYNHKSDAEDSEHAQQSRDGITIQRFQPVNEDGEAGPAHTAPAKPGTTQ